MHHWSAAHLLPGLLCIGMSSEHDDTLLFRLEVHLSLFHPIVLGNLLEEVKVMELLSRRHGGNYRWIGSNGKEQS